MIKSGSVFSFLNLQIIRLDLIIKAALSMDQRELSLLNAKWQDYLKIIRLKSAFLLPPKIIKLFSQMEISAFEDNTEYYTYYYLTPLYEETEGTKNPLPLYKLQFSLAEKLIELKKCPSTQTWLAEGQALQDHFSLDGTAAQNLQGLLDNFKFSESLAKIRVELKLEELKSRYLSAPLTIKAITFENYAYYFTFTDGTQVKVIHLPE